MVKALIRPVAFEESSPDVALLHRVLEVFGLPVAKAEAAESRAGPDTREKVRALQTRLGVPPDDQALVDEATAAAVGEALQRRGLTAASRSFTVAGTARRPDGSVQRRQRLIALDLDLRGVAVYRTARSLAELRQSGGCEFLGAVASDSRGRYRLTFYDWQYRRAERKQADVVVYAVDEGQSGGRILGRSRLVRSDDYSEQGLVDDLDVTIGQADQRPEYEQVMDALQPFLDESRTTLKAIAASAEQLAFTAGELDIELDRIQVAAAAELLAGPQRQRLSHELLYGIGRQGIALDWAVLYRKPEAELRAAIDLSVEQRIIRPLAAREITAFLTALRAQAPRQALASRAADGEHPLTAMLAHALPKEAQRLSFMQAVRSFRGSDFREFWEKHLPAQPEFRQNPELVARVQLAQQLTLLTGNHQALVRALQATRQISSAAQLLDLEEQDWVELLRESGVPDFVQGQADEERMRRYAGLLQGLLNAAFPTRRIARMVERHQLPIAQTAVARGISAFLAQNPHFDFAVSRIHEFDGQIAAASGAHAAAVRSELGKLQRAFQVSTSPEAMAALLRHDLHSAHSIAGIPRKSFVRTYGNVLGGEQAALAIHQRAEHLAVRSESAAMHLWEYAHGHLPGSIMSRAEYDAALAAIQQQVPNYAQLFGSPDICECEHCRSVYSASAYFVDLLRFLWRGAPNSLGKTPLDVLAARRPDLVHLPLTCENTNTLIPYVDLANEVMEYYTAHDSLLNYAGHDTGQATAAELRASPQHFNLEAYRKLKAAPYPFTLPYHQPLDVIRTYSSHLKVSRYEAMQAMNPAPGAATARALAAEALRLSEEEYRALTGVAFDGTADATALCQYYGYTAAGQLENLKAVRELLRRSGLKYTELVELVKTRLINPHQGTLDFLERFASHATLDAATLYARLQQVEAGTLNPAADAALTAALNAYNLAAKASLTAADFAQWVTQHLGEFRQVITLYEPDSRCALDSTQLRTIQSIYSGSATSGISAATWSRLHRLVRLWRKLGWTLYETDGMLAALGESDITAAAIDKLHAVSRLQAATRLAPEQLAVLWGPISTYGKKSLYRKLFLNRAVQQIDSAFAADAWGNYLAGSSEVLADHQSTILAAFRMRAEDLAAILSVARVIDGGNPRPLNLKTDKLNLANLSTIYRYGVLARALKLRVPDLCKLIALFGSSPFSTWDVQQQKFTQIAPDATYRFCQLASAVKAAGFKAPVLEYILKGTLPADSTIGLSRDKALQTARAISAAFAAIEQNHLDTPPSPMTADIVIAKLALTFQPAMVSRLIGILEGTAAFETVTDTNLNITIPAALAARYTYVRGSGRLTCTGVMTDAEQAQLKGLANASAGFQAAVDQLYAAPEKFISQNFSGIFTDLAAARATLLDHPAQPTAAALEQKLAFVYGRFIPILKRKLRQDAITQHIAALIGLSEAATAVLIAGDLQGLMTDLSAAGFSATYFSDSAWTTPVLQRTDSTISFAWGAAAPDPAVPANSFSARWEAYIAAPASGEYTLRVDVAEADEAFRLYLDGTQILEKTAAGAGTSREVVVNLNAAQMHLCRLEYAEAAQDAGVRLQWQTATAAPAVIPATAAYPAAVLDSFVALAAVYHRAARFITGFALSETELNHLIAYSPDFGHIDFKALTAAHWRRISDYTALRQAVPQAQALLTDVFAAANRTSPAPPVAELKALLHKATAWDEANLAFLVDTHFGLAAADFKNEIALGRLDAVMKIVAATGLSAETVSQWGAAETDFDKLHATAQLIKRTVKARYEVEDWLDLAGSLSDTLRAHQQSALVDYLLTRPAIQAWGAKDADGLYEYFLIDVQMAACMDSSRIVQANAAIQMFVNRSLLNLESDTTGGLEQGVSPDAIDKDRWEWMQNYRVWEANRKVFLYPENWLEPEWRRDRSEFFRELESYLVQNDITDRSVEQAFRNYLASLNEVANLDVCGVHRENYDSGKLKYLHVFARTHNTPYKFFYRRWNEYGKWSPWERVPVDIRSVETAGSADGENSGVQLVPVVWKRRLFLFWPEFIRVQEAPGNQGNKSVEEASAEKMSTLQPKEYLEIRLAWSEYAGGKWTPKQVSKEYVREWPSDAFAAAEKDYLLTASISAATQELTLELSDTYWNLHKGKFILADIQSPVRVEHTAYVGWARSFAYEYHFARRRRQGKLELQDDVYLKKSTDHKLLPVDTAQGLDIPLDHPFFFSDPYRTYFVRPVTVTIIEGLKHPEHYVPLIPGLVDDSKARIPIDRLPVGPDDYMPTDVIGPDWAGGPRTHVPAAGGRGQPMMMVAARAPAGAAAAPRAMMMYATGAPAALADDAPVATPYALEMAQTEAAFAGALTEMYQAGEMLAVALRFDTGLEFHTFYHPYSGEYVKRLNQGGLSRLLESDTALASDGGSTFQNAYQPSFDHGLVQKPADFATRTYYKQNVCFDMYGANSSYNWELFFHAPLYIATRLSQNGKYAEAMKWFHYIFDPTTDAAPGPGESATARYWKVLPFKTTPAQSLEDWFRSLSPNANPNTENAVIGAWRDNPFDPHLVAANRPLAYMKHVVTRYVDNLIAWGDSLFRQDTRESVYEAIQLYVLASHILGPRPEYVPKRGEIRAESYESLKHKWDDFSNALVALENIFPYSSAAGAGSSAAGTNLLGVGSALYFCIPANKKLLDYWDTVADRLYKIRHCQNIDGVERKLALFAPPIDPGALVQAAAQGLSLGSILADLSSPPPIYRFPMLIQKANEFCADVRALGAALLAALEKKDAEELARLRAAHEIQMLELMTAIRERQVLDAKAHKENLEKARETASLRLQHYLDLLGNSLTVPAVATVGATLTADSQLPADRAIPIVATDVDDSLVDSDESGVKLIAREASELALAEVSSHLLAASLAADLVSGFLGLIPQFDGEGTPLGVGAGVGFGGRELSWFVGSMAKSFKSSSEQTSMAAARAGKMASYIRREQDWTFQANLAAREIVQLDKQITSADIRIQVAKLELDNHKQQIANAREVELFLKDKFTNQELYQWMKEQLLAVYKQSYNLAYDMAKKAEQAYKFELGMESAGFIQYGYWDNSRQGLVAGEKLQLALRQLEKAYLEGNRRELELTRSISLARLDPLALIELRATGKCYVSVPEELFDLDFRGHYFRRIRAVRLSIPCVAGPHTPVSCTLRLLSNSVRINTTMNSEGKYEHEHDEGLLLDDDRFRTGHPPVKAIATSTAQTDAGLFEFHFRDERYLPFEGAGAISTWQIELSTDKELRQFDYATIADVILHLSYTARESGGLFKQKATDYIKDFLQNAADLSQQPLVQLFSMRHDFPTEWHRFLHPAAAGAEQILRFTPGHDRFPFFVQDRDVVVMKVEVFARCTQATSYDMILAYENLDGDTVTSTPVTMPQNSAYGGLNRATIGVNDAGLSLDEMDIAAQMSLKLKRSAAAGYTALATDPAEVEDVLLVVHYKLG